MKRTKAIKKKGKRPGPKSILTDSMLQQIYRLSLLGLKEVDIATAIGIGHATLDNWKSNKPEVKEAITNGKRKADGKVAQAMYEKACGYSHPDNHIMSNRVNEYKDGEIIRSYVKPLIIPIIKHYPPDTRAGSFWLKNRTRDMDEPWSDRLEVTAPLGGLDISLTNLNLKGFNEKELKFLGALSEKLHIKAKQD